RGGVVVTRERGSDEREDAVALEFVDGAAIASEDLHHALEIAVENADDVLRRQPARQRGEPAQVGHEQGDLTALASELEPVRRVEQRIDHLLGAVAAERVANEIALAPPPPHAPERPPP